MLNRPVFSSNVVDRNGEYMQLSSYCKHEFSMCEELKSSKMIQHLHPLGNDRNVEKETDRTQFSADITRQSSTEVSGAIMIQASRRAGQ